MTAYEKIVAILQSNGVKFAIIEHAPVLTVEDYSNNLPFKKEKIVKTLVYRVKNLFWILVAVRGEDRIDFGKLAKSLGMSRDSLGRPGIKEIETELGFQIGGIGPFPTQEDVRVVFDKKIFDLDIVYCGVGRTDGSLEITPDELKKVCTPIVCDITQ